jgi:PhnB protein
MEKTTRSKSVRAVPEGYHTVTPYLVVDDAQALIEFTQKAFNAKLAYIVKRDDGGVMHATLTIGDSTVMISDTMEGMRPQTAMLYLYLENVDGVFRKAVEANGAVLHEPKTEFYGDRAGAVKDQWGNVWWIATHVEDVDPQEMEERGKKAMQEQKQKGDKVHS